MALFRLRFLLSATTRNYKEEGFFFSMTSQTMQLKLQIKSGDFLGRFFFFIIIFLSRLVCVCALHCAVAIS